MKPGNIFLLCKYSYLIIFMNLLNNYLFAQISLILKTFPEKKISFYDKALNSIVYINKIDPVLYSAHFR